MQNRFLWGVGYWVLGGMVWMLASGGGVASGADHQIFLEKCGGKKTDFDLRLDKACEKYPGKVLVRCKEECVDRGGVKDLFKCQKRKWVQTEILADGAVCQSDGDRNKTRGCSSSELPLIQEAFQGAQKQAPGLLEKISVVTKKMKASKDPSSDKWEKAEKCMGKVIDSMKTQYTYACPNNNEGINGKVCVKDNTKTSFTLAFDRSGGVKRVFFCEAYFKFNPQTRASTLVHETTHEVCGTDDSGPHDGYYYDSSEIRSGEPWEKTASTYDNWLDHGFCIPKKDKCQSYESWLKENS